MGGPGVERPSRPRHPVAPLVVVALVVPAGLVLGAGTTAWAAPTVSTTLSFDVVGTPGGGLHLSVAPEGGLGSPSGAHPAEAPLPPAVVRDDRGGGAREWSATVAVVGFDKSTAVSYRVDSLRPPDTGTVLNRMPAWTTVSAPEEAVVASGISRPSVVSAWDPRLRVASPSGGAGSTDAGSSGSVGSSDFSGSVGSSGSPAPTRRSALITSVL